MKNRLILSAFILILFSIAGVSAAVCSLDADLINQDPYPAVPGEYVKVLFQISGIENPECGRVTFEFVPEFPFSLDPGQDATLTVSGGNYYTDYRNVLQVPYKIRVDKNALTKETPLTVRFRGIDNSNLFVVKKFNITIEEVITDFEVSVRDYDSSTSTITFDILNVGENDIEALTIETNQQENFAVKGNNRNIIGSLDSNEDTTFTFEGTPKDGAITLTIFYTDQINTRRSVEKTVIFDSSRFEGRANASKGVSGWLYITILVIIISAFIIWRYRKQIKKLKLHHQQNHKD